MCRLRLSSRPDGLIHLRGVIEVVPTTTASATGPDSEFQPESASLQIPAAAPSPVPAIPPTSDRERALLGWRSWLAVLVVALLAALAISGLWMYLAPFSMASQLLVLLHAALGLTLVLPFAIYSARHLKGWWSQRLTAEKLLGYALLGLGTASIVSGLVLTAQAAFGRRITELWDLIHLVGGFAVAALLVLHITLAYFRRRSRSAPWPEYTHAVRGFTARNALVVGALAVLVGGAATLWPARPTTLPLPDGYTLPAYSQQFDEYRGSPFAPTYARTVEGTLIDPDVLSGSASCGTSRCHEQILAEWEPSAHRFAAMNPPFQAVQKNFAADREPAETRYCAGCHDPISLFAGAKDIHTLDLSAPGMQEGVSCAACHSISEVDERGNADYVLTPPNEYLWTANEGPRKAVSDFLIRAYPRQHLADYDRNILRTPEFCGTCHKQFIPEALNRFGMSPGQNQYDEWKESHWNSDDVTTDLSCRDCHMRLVPDSADPGRGEGGDDRRTPDDDAHRHHGTIATNMFMPELLKLPNWEEQVALTVEWIQGQTVIPEIADVWPEGPVASVEILAPPSVEPGAEIALRAIVTNRKAGHNFTTGPLDFMQSWIHLRAVDADGRLVAEYGALDPDTRYVLDGDGRPHEIGNPRDEGTLMLEGMPLDEFGDKLLEHELWRKAGGVGQRVIFPRYTDTQVYRFEIPSDARGPITITADLNFRRYRQDFLDRVVPGMEDEWGVRQRVVTHNSATATVSLNSAESRSGSRSDTP